MSQFTDELRREHTVIHAAIKKARELGLNSKSGTDAFLGIKDLVLSHLRKGEQKLYTPLRAAAKTNQELQFVLDLHSQSADATTRLTEEFFVKYGHIDDTSDLTFIMDFGKVSAMLGARIRNEENALLAAFDKLKLS